MMTLKITYINLSEDLKKKGLTIYHFCKNNEYVIMKKYIMGLWVVYANRNWKIEIGQRNL